MGIACVGRDAAKLECRDSPLAGNFQPARRPRLLQLEPTSEAGALQVAIEPAAQAAVGGEDKQSGMANRFAWFEKWMMDIQATGEQVADELRHEVGVRRGGRRAVHRLL